MAVTKERKKLAEFTFQGNLSQTMISINQIKLPDYQPRIYFDEKQLQQLTQSIKKYGILEPLIVRTKPFSNLYELVAGGRRYQAAKLANLSEVPVTIKDLNDDQVIEIALLENLQREDLNPIEETQGILKLLAIRLAIDIKKIPAYLYKLNRQYQGQIKSDNNVITKEIVKVIQQVFDDLGKFTVQSFVQNRLPLLNLPLDVLQALKEEKLAYTKGRAIAKVEDFEQRTQLLQEAITQKLSLSKIREKVRYINFQNKTFILNSISIKERAQRVFKTLSKSEILKEPKTQRKFEKLLEKIEVLLEINQS